MSRRVRVLILAFAGILALGLFAWTERTNDLSRAEAVQARGALRERYRNPASRPSPQALAAELWAPTATGPVVWAPKGLRVHVASFSYRDGVFRCALRRRLASIGQPLSLPERAAIAHLTLVVRLPPPGWMLWIAPFRRPLRCGWRGGCLFVAPMRADKARSSARVAVWDRRWARRARRRSPALRLW